MSHRLVCTLGLVLAACSSAGDGPAAPDPGPPRLQLGANWYP